MIRVSRRAPEPPELVTVRNRELPKLEAIRARGESIKGDDIKGYDVVKRILWEDQHNKCCYCEHRSYSDYNDVEHYRPKARADRLPGSSENYGYWWLAFTWENLLFACPSCNRSGKYDQFPLKVGSAALAEREMPNGREVPLLIDPAVQSAMPHIRYKPDNSTGETLWVAEARNGSEYGDYTIRVCDLNDDGVVTLRSGHIERLVMREVRRIQSVPANDRTALVDTVDEIVRHFLDPAAEFVGATYDALVYHTDAILAKHGLTWPMPM